MSEEPGLRRKTVQVLCRTLVALAVLVPFVWSIGFVRYVAAVPREINQSGANADAVVVLTGGTKRVAAGFQLLIDGRAKTLFISGVFSDVRRVDLQALAKKEDVEISDQLLSCCVELGFEAKDTRGNAVETAKWIKSRKARTMLLVTSNYHMPRSLFELYQLMPHIKIISYPVVSDTLMLDTLWQWPGSFKLLWTEYHKLLIAGTFGALERWPSG
ncbi:MAG: hypothetical protein CMM47_06775 [Rhodospirillaceae bacterium]|nr:hypothetical protein [Rhodospirillaceae bacterium]